MINDKVNSKDNYIVSKFGNLPQLNPENIYESIALLSTQEIEEINQTHFNDT